MAKFKVLSHLTHDGTEYPVGTEVEMDAKSAKPLVRDGVLEDPNAEKPTPTPVARTPRTKAEKEAEAKAKAARNAKDGEGKPEGDTGNTGEGTGEGDEGNNGEGGQSGNGEGGSNGDAGANL